MNPIRSTCFWCVVALLIVLGCSKKDDPAVIKCFPTAASISAAGTSDKTNFLYGSDNKLTAMKTNAYELAYSYNASGNVSKVVRTDQSKTERVEFTYNAKNQVTEANTFPSTGSSQRVTYEYNQTGQLIKVVSAGITETYEYPNTTTKNKSRAKTVDANGTTQATVDLTYDDKKTPYANLGIEPYMSDFSVNNVLKETYKSDLFSFTVTYVYQYNDRGYPTAFTGALAVEGVPGSIPVTGSYTYDCK